MSDTIPLGDMDPDDFRQAGHHLIDWIADYLQHPERYPVLSRNAPGDVTHQLPTTPPQTAETIHTVLADFENIIMPGITHWNQPGFMAYFANTGSGPGILGELLSAALNVNAMLWRTSPAATELEEVTVDWMRQLIGLPDTFSGIIMDGASAASMIALAAAREALNLNIRQQGMAGRNDLPRLRVYTSEQAHSSIEKGAMILGFGQEGVRLIPTNDEFRMDVTALAEAIETDIAEGWQPCCVVATVGTTSTTSIDPVPAIAALCQEYGLWLHVDGAYGGVAAIVPEMRHILDGCEHADSVVTNPHKWLFTPVDCSLFYIRDPHILKRAFSLVPEYLKTGQDEVTNYMDWGVQLGRRFRALKLWMVIRTFGAEGLAARLREHIRLAQDLAQKIDADPGFERLAPTPFSTVCFRARPDQNLPDSALDQLNAAIIETVNDTGEIYLSHTRLNGHYTLRLTIGHIRTDTAYVNRAWKLIREAAARLHLP